MGIIIKHHNLLFDKCLNSMLYYAQILLNIFNIDSSSYILVQMENSSKISFQYLISWITQIWQNVQAKAEHIIENPSSIFQHLLKLQRKLFTQYQPYAVSASIFTVTFAWSYFCYRRQLAIQLQNKALNNTSHYQIEQSDENQLSGQFFRKHVIQLTKDTQHGVPIQLTTNSIIQEAQMQEEIDKQDKYFFSVYETYMKTDSQRR